MQASEKDAPLDWYLWMSVFTGAALLLVVAPEFVQSAIQGKLNPALIGQGIQKRAAQVQSVITGNAAIASQSVAEKLFGEVGNLGVGAWAIGSAEGTLDHDGNPTSLYEGHDDPGNGAGNKGFGSWQASPVANAQEGDAKALERLKTQCIPYTLKTFQENKLTLTPRLLVESCDAWIQAPLAAADFAKNLKVCNDEGKQGDEAILCTRTRSYINPDTGSLDVTGIFQQDGALEHDQRRRMGEIAAVFAKHGDKFPQSLNPAPSSPTSPASSVTPGSSDPSQAIARLQIGRETCTAFFVKPNELLTAGHCFKKAKTGTMTMRDGKTATATFKIAAAKDVAVAIVDGSFPVLEKGATSGEAEVKGYRLGQWTESTGRVTGNNQQGDLTFTASPSIEPGYSGAPLLTKDGKFIGVVVGVDRRTNTAVAIPAKAIAY
jgi:hypothetical protein